MVKQINWLCCHSSICIVTTLQGTKIDPTIYDSYFDLFFERQAFDFRIDTHPENIPMQAVIRDNGFTKQGIVRIDEGTDSSIRWAYQLLLK